MSKRKPMERADLWPLERAELCKKLWLAGNSASLCAQAIGEGLTRSAVIGKMNRMGFKREAASGPSRALAYPQRAAVKLGRRKFVGVVPGWNDGPPVAPTTLHRRGDPIESPNAKVWTERTFGECAYPVDGEKADTRSCCNPTGGETYCGAHHRLMRNGAPKPNTAFVERKPKPERVFDGWAA